MLLLLGMVLGCLNAWYWLSQEQRIIGKERQEAAKPGSEEGATKDQ
jgi:hypothetical protein